MTERQALDAALQDLAGNAEQLQAVTARTHCVVLAGPGSGKTKTLTTAMARALLEDVVEPRGAACVTYNNECAIELEARLAALGVEPGRRVFVGTVHSFALAHVVSPYARCVATDLPETFRVASYAETRESVRAAYIKTINSGENPNDRWRFAEQKRRQDVDRTTPSWLGKNPELARFIEAYEADLRIRGLIDFDDMPLIAYRIIRENPWVRDSLMAQFPILFVDEYQDLGHALHQLVLELCIRTGIRLFAVGDPDQSVYNFTGANPALLRDLAARDDVSTIRLRFNYRCGSRIIDASMAALGEERDYCTADESTAQGSVVFRGIDGAASIQADYVAQAIVPSLVERGIPIDEIAVLYRTAAEGDQVAAAAIAAGLPIVRSDNRALIKRNSRVARWIESAATWVVDGWRTADPPFRRLWRQATTIVYGSDASEEESSTLQRELVVFLQGSIKDAHSTNIWLRELKAELIEPWQARARAFTNDWSVVDEMIDRTDASSKDGDIPLSHFAGRIEGHGRLSLSTFHSAKGREFDAVVLFGMDDDVFPSWREKTADAILEARRLFYVGVTRSRREVILVFRKNHHSPWVKELYDRVTAKDG